MIGIRYEEIPVLDPLMEPRIGTNNKPVLTISNRAVGGSENSDVCPIPPPCAPPYVLWNNSIGNIPRTNTPKFRQSNEFNAPIDRILTPLSYCVIPHKSDIWS